MRVPEKLIALLKERPGFFIATHISPEGDALGSSLALSLALESLGKETVLYDRDAVPPFYRFLPGAGRFTTATHLLGRSGQAMILLDCNEPARAGLEEGMLPFSIVIDHHETERDFGDFRWIEPHAAATGLMIYHLLKALGCAITREIAINLYTAIAIDTGTFRFSNTTPDVLRTAAELIAAGADPGAIAINLYETWTERRFRLLIEVLKTLEIVGDIAFTVATRETFMKTGTSPEDVEDFSNFPRMMENVSVSAFFRELDEGWKVSLRSKGARNVARIAAQFQGGGHRNAAGFRIKADLKTAKDVLLKAFTGAAK